MSTSDNKWNYKDGDISHTEEYICLSGSWLNSKYPQNYRVPYKDYVPFSMTK